MPGIITGALIFLGLSYLVFFGAQVYHRVKTGHGRNKNTKFV